MPIVTFWSNSEKTIGQTVAASVAATVMAMERNYKILLVSVDVNNDSIENCFGSQQSNKNIIKNIISTPKINLDTGTNGLIKMAKSNRVTPELIKDYTKIIFKDRLEILYSSTNEEIPINEQIECYKNIILNANKYYDYVIVDLKKGLRYTEILDILELSNVIVLNTEQGIKTLEEFNLNSNVRKFMNSYKVIWNICKYDTKSKYNIKNLNRTVWKKQPIYNIPYNTLLFDASSEGKLPEMIVNITTIKSEDDSKELFNEANKLIEGIMLRQQELQMRM